MGLFALAALLILLALAGVVLRKTYFYVPLKELQRQAEAGDKLARQLYRAATYGNSLRVLLWLIIVLASAGGFVLLARLAPAWLGFVVVVLVLWLGFSWLPNTRVTVVGARLSLWATPVLAKILSYAHPVLSRLAETVHGHYEHPHTGLYESEDLLELVRQQRAQADSRIGTHDLEVIERALSSRHLRVRDIVTPRSQLKMLAEGDTIGPVLLDELHQSGQSCFLVYAGQADKITGVLYLRDVSLKTEGKVRDHMVPEVRYVHENDSLHQALQAFHKTKHQLFVVVNGLEELLGVVTLESVLHQLVGVPLADDFDRHDDAAAVAAKHTPSAPVLDKLAEAEDTPEAAEQEASEPEAAPTEPESPGFAVHHYEETEPAEEKSPDPVDEKEEPTSVETGKAPDPDDLAALDLPDEPEEPATSRKQP